MFVMRNLYTLGETLQNFVINIINYLCVMEYVSEILPIIAWTVKRETIWRIEYLKKFDQYSQGNNGVNNVIKVQRKILSLQKSLLKK